MENNFSEEKKKAIILSKYLSLKEMSAFTNSISTSPALLRKGNLVRMIFSQRMSSSSKKGSDKGSGLAAPKGHENNIDNIDNKKKKNDGPSAASSTSGGGGSDVIERTSSIIKPNHNNKDKDKDKDKGRSFLIEESNLSRKPLKQLFKKQKFDPRHGSVMVGDERCLVRRMQHIS